MTNGRIRKLQNYMDRGIRATDVPNCTPTLQPAGAFPDGPNLQITSQEAPRTNLIKPRREWANQADRELVELPKAKVDSQPPKQIVGSCGAGSVTSCPEVFGLPPWALALPLFSQLHPHPKTIRHARKTFQE